MKTSKEINIDEAKYFINLLSGCEGGRFAFQTFDDVDEREVPEHNKRHDLTKVLCGTFEEHIEELVSLNDKGAGIFVTVNKTDESGKRNADNIIGLRALFVDKDDGDLPTEWDLKPSIIIQTKKGQHAYWLLKEGESLEKFKAAQRALIEKFGTDKSVHDLSRVMRLPGFYHKKNPQKPFMVRIVHSSDQRYTIDQVLNAFGLSLNQTQPPQTSSSDGAAEIKSGKRNSTLMSMAGTFRRKGLDCDEIFTSIAMVNKKRCKPPLDDSELLQIAESASRYSKDKGEDVEDRTQAVKLIALAQGIEFFRTPDDIAYAAIQIDNHVEVQKVGSRNFKQYLCRKFYLDEKAVPKQQAISDAIGVLEAKSKFEGKEIQLFRRIAGSNGLILIDLMNKNGQIVEISNEGWATKTSTVPRFIQKRGMQSLPVPIQNGDISELRKFLNVASDDDWMLIVGWLVAAFRDKGPYPVLILLGEQGCAKSTTARVLRSLIDPSIALLRTAPRSERDLSISANNSWILAYDNLSGMQPWLSDALCRISTGGGFSTRELRTDDDEVIFDSQRPIILNGIDEVATRPDLLDRSLVITLPVIPEQLRKAEESFWKEFEEAKPRILGALLSAVSSAMNRVSDVVIEKSPRMKDFSIWVSAASSALGFTQEQFLDAFMKNRKHSIQTGIESSVVAQAVIKLIEEKDEWKGTYADLLTIFQKDWKDLPGSKDFPTKGIELSNALRRVAPNLRNVGINIIQGTDAKRKAGTGARQVRIERTVAQEND